MKHFNFQTDYVFPTISRYLGYLLSLLGIIAVISGSIPMLLLCFFGLGLSFTRNGVLIDQENLKMKEYLEIFWLKKGKWKSMELYPYLTILEITEKNSMYGARSNVEHISRQMVYRVTLLNSNHREKILLKQFKNKEVAHNEGEKMATNLQIEKVIYDPRKYF